MYKKIAVVFILFLSSCVSIKKFPTKNFYTFLYYFDRSNDGDLITFHLKNPVKCPINIKLVEDSKNPELSSLFGHIVLRELQDTIIKIKYQNFDASIKSKYTVRLGNYEQKISKTPVAFPFPKGKNYKIIQGYNNKFSHNGIYSKNAIDFNLKIGDTIQAVDDGYVVEMIEGYSKSGTSEEWINTDKSNYITIYHPSSGIYSQYVHLNLNGSLVKLNEFVKRNQAIAISGMTGYTTTPHLHFNIKIPTKNDGLISTEIDFENGIKGSDLKINNIVKK